MAFSIPFKNKYVYFPDSCLHTQGEARAETYDLTGPRYYDGRDLSQLSWYARATHPDYRTIISRQLTASVDPEDDALLIVTWPMEADFLAYPGQLMVEFVAKTADGEEIIKLQSNGLKIAASVEGSAAPPKNLFETAITQMEQLANDAANSAAQSKLDADRAEDAQAAAAQSAQQAKQAQQDIAEDVAQAEELVGQIEGDAAAAAKSAEAAKASETNAAASKTAAANSASAAKTSETNAAASKTAAEKSAAAAKTSETNAASSASAAAGSASAAKTSETNAASSKTAAADSATKAKASEDAAAVSKNAAASSASAAKTSETNAAASKTAAASSASAAKTSETNAAASASAAASSASAANTSETNAAASKTAAANSASAAKTSETNAASSKSAAASSASAAAQAKTAAEAAADRAEAAAGQIDMTNYLLKTGDGKDVTVTFTPSSAAEFPAPTSGAKLSAIMVMLSKWRNYISRALTPTGAMLLYAGNTVPTGFLLCDGRAVSRTTYAALFAAIGTTHGSGDGSTTFNLPDMRGRTAVGVAPDTNLGSKSGAANVSLTAAQNGRHAHPLPIDYGSASGTMRGVPHWSDKSSYDEYHVFDTGYSGEGAAHENRQPSLYLYHIIKT